MKKIFLIGVCGLSLMSGMAYANNMNMGMDMKGMNMAPKDPVCQEAMTHMRATHEKVEAAIKANDAQKVGELVIACHKYMEEFTAKHPQCKPKHEMMM